MNRDVCEHFNPIDLSCDKCDEKRKSEASFLADELEIPLGTVIGSEVHRRAAAELRRLHAKIAACEPYLKEGETPAERIERDHRDSLALMTLLAREKTKNEALLEALKMLVLATKDFSIGHYNEEVHDIALSKARAAIANAEEQA